MARVGQRGSVEAKPGPEHDGCRECERRPLPAVELEREHHGQDHQWGRQGRGCREARPQVSGVRVLGVAARLEAGLVAGRLDGPQQIVDDCTIGSKLTEACSVA